MFLLLLVVDANALPTDEDPYFRQDSSRGTEQPFEHLGITVEAEHFEQECNLGSIVNDVGVRSYFTNADCLETAMSMFPPATGEVQYCRIASMNGTMFGIFFNGPPGFISQAEPPFKEC